MAVRFGPFTLDLAQRLLTRDGQPVHLAPKAFDVLARLVAEGPRAVPKDELLATVWRDVFVTESTLSTTIRDLRKALGDDAGEPRFIRTVFAFGFAFVADVADETAPAPAAASIWRLVGEHVDLPLLVGANVVGRGAPDVLAIDTPTISRRHARLTVTQGLVTCEDLDSKNGTWVGTTRVTTAVPVRDGDAIRFGAVLTTLRRLGPASTESMPLVEPP